MNLCSSVSFWTDALIPKRLNVDVSAPAIIYRSPGRLPGFSLHISRPFESDFVLALHGAKFRQESDPAWTGHSGGWNPWWLWPGVCRPEPVVRRVNWSAGSRLNNFVRSELPSMPRRRTSVTAPMTVQPASHPSIAATQSPSTAPAESIQTTKKETRANAVHTAKAKIARRNSLRTQRLLQKKSHSWEIRWVERNLGPKANNRE
jgi:hypothetical protein